LFITIDFTSWRCSPPCSPPLISHHYNVPHQILHHWFHIITMFPTKFSTIDFTSLQCSPPLISHHYNVPHQVLHHWFYIITMFPTMSSTIDFTSRQCFPPCSPPLIHITSGTDSMKRGRTLVWKEEEHLSQLRKNLIKYLNKTWDVVPFDWEGGIPRFHKFVHSHKSNKIS
jgi:hypothetical protein